MNAFLLITASLAAAIQAVFAAQSIENAGVKPASPASSPVSGATQAGSSAFSLDPAPPNIAPGVAPSGIGGGVGPTGIGPAVAPTGIGAGIGPSGIGGGIGPSGIGHGIGVTGPVATGTAANGAFVIRPRSLTRKQDVQVPVFTELGDSTTGFAAGSSTIGSLGMSTSGSLGRSTTGIGGVGTSEIGTGFGANIADTNSNILIPEKVPLATFALTNALPTVLPNGGMLSSNWRGEPIVIFPTPPPALPAGSREEFDARPSPF